ncbi:MAG TPA: PilZ domain-containing protein [Candidatus Angelobacter sp.]|nr:PilZ domain-containing protein [Candidatus Angelobacter sp.]
MVLCDYDAPGASQLACLQPNTKWRGISMVIVGTQHSRDLHDRRIHFTLAKPLSLDVVGRSLRASYTTMARRRSAAYRHTLALKPLAGTLEYRGRQRPLPYTSIANLSQTGLCLSGPEPLPQGGTVSVNFSLPDTDEVLHVLGTIIWSDTSGKSGVRFRGISSEQERRLQQSLKARLPWNVDSLIPAD